MKLTRRKGILGTIFQIKKGKTRQKGICISIYPLMLVFRGNSSGQQNLSITFMWPNSKVKEN